MIRAISLALLCAASFVAAYWATAPGADEPVADATTQSPTPTASDAVAIDSTNLALRSEPTHPVRDVTPSNVTAGPVVTGPLVRVTPPVAEEPAPSPQAKRELLYRPVVLSAGVVKARDLEIHLAGIAVTEPKRSCGEGASAWPCGRVARTALRRFIRGRAIGCEVPPGADAIPNPAHCFVGDDDIARWLVAQGWAKPDGDAYKGEADAAKEMELGLYSKSRPDPQPDEVAAQR
jgi:endonuclease YncB( thermonuclease family)